MSRNRDCPACFDQPGTVRMWGAVEWCEPCALQKGGLVGRRAVTLLRLGSDPSRYTPEVLKALANGPVMDANVLYAPAGKLSMAETRAREAAVVLRSEVDDPSQAPLGDTQ